MIHILSYWLDRKCLKLKRICQVERAKLEDGSVSGNLGYKWHSIPWYQNRVQVLWSEIVSSRLNIGRLKTSKFRWEKWNYRGSYTLKLTWSQQIICARPHIKISASKPRWAKEEGSRKRPNPNFSLIFLHFLSSLFEFHIESRGTGNQYFKVNSTILKYKG